MSSPDKHATVMALLQKESEVLRNPKENLVRRLEALYALKKEAFNVHPRFNVADRARCPASVLKHHHEEHDAEALVKKKQHDEEQQHERSLNRSGSGAALAASANNNGEEQQQEGGQHEGSPTTRQINNWEQSCNGSEAEIMSFVVNTFHEAIDTTDSVLLQHELLYNIGQFGAHRSIPVCINVLKEYKKYHEVSRHEAIEAIGAIGFPDESVPALKATMASLPPEALTPPIVESAELALRRLELVKKYGQAHVLREHGHRDFCSVDPAPSNGVKDIKELRHVLLDPNADMFARYQAMFALRNLNNPKAVEVLCEALVEDKSSCLFRHEIAFVLGQLEYSSSVPALKHALLNEAEHGMVRHEAAEALGAIGSKECVELLTQYQKHGDRLVADSCYAAIQLMDDPVDVVEVKYEVK